MSSTSKTVTLVNRYPNACKIGLLYAGPGDVVGTPWVELAPDGAATLTVTDASDKPYPPTESTSFRATAHNMKDQSYDTYYDGNWGDVVYALGVGDIPYVKGERPIEVTYPSS